MASPFAVLVRREVQLVGPLEQLPQLGDLGLFILGDDVEGLEIVLHVHPQPGPGFVLELGGDLRAVEGRSRMCPTDDSTAKSAPRYLEMVRAFAGDSTMTSAFDMGR
jgi:hypothetical protein